MYLSLVQEYRYEFAYTLLVFARIVFAFAGKGYIHPDEYFQNGEVTAGHLNWSILNVPGSFVMLRQRVWPAYTEDMGVGPVVPLPVHRSTRTDHRGSL